MNGDEDFKQTKQDKARIKRPNHSSDFQETTDPSRKRQKIESRDVILIEDSTYFNSTTVFSFDEKVQQKVTLVSNNESTTQQPNVFQLLAPKPGSSFKKVPKRKPSDLTGTIYSKMFHLFFDGKIWRALFLQNEQQFFELKQQQQQPQQSQSPLQPQQSQQSQQQQQSQTFTHLRYDGHLECWYWTKYYNETTVSSIENQLRGVSISSARIELEKLQSQTSSTTHQNRIHDQLMSETQVSQQSLTLVSFCDDKNTYLYSQEISSIKWSQPDPAIVRQCYGKEQHLKLQLSSNVNITKETIDLSDRSLPSNTFEQHHGYCTLSVGVLKSLLQKNIRRSRPESAVRVALQLIKLNFVEFLRRICVIMMEDVILHPSLPVVVWLMIVSSNISKVKHDVSSLRNTSPKKTTAASKTEVGVTFQTKETQHSTLTLHSDLLNFLLKLTYDLASSPYRDDYTQLDNLHLFCTKPISSSSSSSSSSSTKQSSQKISKQTQLVQSQDSTQQRTKLKEETSENDLLQVPTMEQINNLPLEEASLIHALLTRASYGGLVWDVKMLRQFATLWYLRFTNKIQMPEFVVKSSEYVPGMTWLDWIKRIYRFHEQQTTTIHFKNVGPISFQDCLLDAIDMHCSPIISNLLANLNIREIVSEYMREAFPFQKISNDFVEKKLRDMIWWFRSSINNKHNIMKIHHRDKTVETSEEDEKRKLESLYDSLRTHLDSFAYGFYRTHFVELKKAETTSTLSSKK